MHCCQGRGEAGRDAPRPPQRGRGKGLRFGRRPAYLIVHACKSWSPMLPSSSQPGNTSSSNSNLNPSPTHTISDRQLPSFSSHPTPSRNSKSIARRKTLCLPFSNTDSSSNSNRQNVNRSLVSSRLQGGDVPKPTRRAPSSAPRSVSTVPFGHALDALALQMAPC